MKRFTDTEKWTKDRWFSDLEPRYKLLWLFMVDSCDNVGVWEENIRMANVLIGFDYSLDTVLKVFGNRIYVFDEGRKWWLQGFIRFQHADMSEDSQSKAVQSYVTLLKLHGLWIQYAKSLETLQGKGEGKGLEKAKVRAKVASDYTPEFEEWWGVYKTGVKSNAFEAWKKQSPMPENLIDITKQYKAYCASADRQVKDGQGFLNQRMFESEWTHVAQGTKPNLAQYSKTGSAKPIQMI